MVTNRVFKVLATNGTQMTNLADTGVSEYLIIDETGATVTAATAATMEKDDKFQIVVNSPNGGKVFSDRIRVGDITAYNKRDYAAKVEEVVTVTLATPVAGIEYTVSVIDKSDKEILQCRQNKRTYSVIAATGETVTTLGDKFRALINADVASTVTATGTTTLILTAKSVANVANMVGEYPPQYYFQVFSSSIDNTIYPIAFPQASGTVVYTTAPSYGSGQYFQVKTLEMESLGYRGITNRTKFPVPQGDYLSVAGTNYDLVVLEYENRHDTNTVVEGETTDPISIIVAVTADAGDATIIPILDALALRNAALAAAIAAAGA